MAKKSVIARERKRERLVLKYKEKRLALKMVLNNPSASFEEKELASMQLQKLPRDSSSVRLRNRCRLTGRPHGYFRKFGLSRNMLREASMRGDVPGIRKASW
ncbi:MAG TPA: 30S ribosomal protein S14 [Crenotrichaceae bacterium]|nr:30S ribosomal protein S14 [Crenotrichaceae bacterium]